MLIKLVVGGDKVNKYVVLLGVFQEFIVKIKGM